ncbi:MAG TPA: hypothetical protein VGF13_19790 [Verrucomicrobiae bacterium]|jgi:hypothetical protein
MKVLFVLAAGLFIAGCGREDGKGANSPVASSGRGEKGLSNDINSVGSTLGPLGATSISPGVVTTGTAAELLIKTTNGQPFRRPPAPSQ